VLPPVSMKSLIGLAEIQTNPHDNNTFHQATAHHALLNSQPHPKQAVQLPPSPPASTPPTEESSSAAVASTRSGAYKPQWQGVESSGAAGPPPPLGEKRQEPCAFFNRKNGCRWGDDCRFLHEKDLVPANKKDIPTKALKETWWRAGGSGSGNNKPDSLVSPPFSLFEVIFCLNAV
jgi:hypothetical protein